MAFTSLLVARVRAQAPLTSASVQDQVKLLHESVRLAKEQLAKKADDLVLLDGR